MNGAELTADGGMTVGVPFPTGVAPRLRHGPLIRRESARPRITGSDPVPGEIGVRPQNVSHTEDARVARSGTRFARMVRTARGWLRATRLGRGALRALQRPVVAACQARLEEPLLDHRDRGRHRARRALRLVRRQQEQELREAAVDELLRLDVLDDVRARLAEQVLVDDEQPARRLRRPRPRGPSCRRRPATRGGRSASARRPSRARLEGAVARRCRPSTATTSRCGTARRRRRRSRRPAARRPPRCAPA